MIFSTDGQWSYRQQGEKWVVSKWTSERMRICTDGTVLYHDNPLEHQVAELYEFQTEWAAESHARFCNRLENNYGAITFTHPWSVDGRVSVIGSSTNQFEFWQAGREIICIGSGNEVKTFDLPYLIWIWLRTTWLGRGLKAFWYGWGK